MKRKNAYQIDTSGISVAASVLKPEDILCFRDFLVCSHLPQIVGHSMPFFSIPGSQLKNGENRLVMLNRTLKSAIDGVRR